MAWDLSSAGWNADVASGFRRYRRVDAYPARVARLDGGVCTVLTAGGIARTTLGGGVLATGAADPRRLPAVGDWVVVRAWPDRRTSVEAVLPRRNAILAGMSTRPLTLATNLDLVAVVAEVPPQSEGARVAAHIVRLLHLLESRDTRSMVILTTVDSDTHAGPDRSAAVAGVRAAVLAAYGAPAPVVFTVGPGPDPGTVRELVPPATTLGLVGVGPHAARALLDTLAGACVLRARGPAERRGYGGPVLYPVPEGGVVIDIPERAVVSRGASAAR
jgi:ribosome biogenesis GTPase